MRTNITLIFAVAVTVIVGCANPLNQATSIRYSEACSAADRNGRLDVAEEACSRALVNVDWGNLGEIQKSDRLYNLGRIKKQLSKFSEAEKLYLASLEIEDKQAQKNHEKIGRRLAELAIVYDEVQKQETGMQYVKRLYALPYEYSGQENIIVAAVLYVYADQFELAGDRQTAEKLKSRALEMGFDPKVLEE